MTDVRNKHEQCEHAVEEYKIYVAENNPALNTTPTSLEDVRKWKLDIQFELESSKIEQNRALEDLERTWERQQQDLQRQLEFEQRREIKLSKGGTPGFQSSTPNDSHIFLDRSCSGVPLIQSNLPPITTAASSLTTPSQPAVNVQSATTAALPTT